MPNLTERAPVRTYLVHRTYGDTVTETATVTSTRGRYDAARRYLSRWAQGGLKMSDRRPDDVTPGATRWTLTDRDGFPAGGVVVIEQPAEPEQPAPVLGPVCAACGDDTCTAPDAHHTVTAAAVAIASVARGLVGGPSDDGEHGGACDCPRCMAVARTAVALARAVVEPEQPEPVRVTVSVPSVDGSRTYVGGVRRDAADGGKPSAVPLGAVLRGDLNRETGVWSWWVSSTEPVEVTHRHTSPEGALRAYLAALYPGRAVVVGDTPETDPARREATGYGDPREVEPFTVRPEPSLSCEVCGQPVPEGDTLCDRCLAERPAPGSADDGHGEPYSPDGHDSWTWHVGADLCGRCGVPIFGVGAVSRADNVTRLCGPCGTAEALAAHLAAYGSEVEPEGQA